MGRVGEVSDTRSSTTAQNIQNQNTGDFTGDVFPSFFSKEKLGESGNVAGPLNKKNLGLVPNGFWEVSAQDLAFFFLTN